MSHHATKESHLFLVAVLILVASSLSYPASILIGWKREQTAIKALSSLGAEVYAESIWLDRLTGLTPPRFRKYLSRAHGVSFDQSVLKDRTELKHLASISALRRLMLRNKSVRRRTCSSLGSGVTDQGLIHVTNLKKLRDLNVEGSQVTTNGIETLRNSMPKLNVDGL
jgi:hypothetical protein